MENFIKCPLGNYGIYKLGLWHISYAIKLWFNNANEGFVKGLTKSWWTMEKSRELDYGTMGLDFVSSGGQVGAFKAPRIT